MAIIGVGNVLMGDDGVGVHVVERLREGSLPEGVELHDAGTAIQDVLPQLTGCDRVIVVDAVQTGGAPGTVHAFDLGPEMIGSDGAALSVHDMDLVAALRFQMVVGEPVPSVRILGVEPREVTLSLELSDEVRARLPEVAELALREACEACRACAQAGGRT